MLQQRPLEPLTAGVVVPREESGGALPPRVVPVPRCDGNMGAGDGATCYPCRRDVSGQMWRLIRILKDE